MSKQEAVLSHFASTGCERQSYRAVAEWDKAEVSIGAVASRRRDVLGGSGRPRPAHASLTNV